jgi:adenosylcobinamide-GDP ribazoletransferase
MDAVHLRATLRIFPLFGLLKGLVYGGVFWVLLEWSPLSVLGIAFLLWLLPILWTGGLHLDGWMDASDAFFSYRDLERRLEILKDPRIGAFGVLSLIVLLAARFVFVYEVVAYGDSQLAFLIGMIPFFSQLLIGLLLNYVPPAKKEGLGYYFQQGKDRLLAVSYILWIIALGTAIWLGIRESMFVFLIFTVAAWLFYLIARSRIIKNFGGITGDLLGASLEGAELLLWMTLWLSVFTVMG